jgi:hypothetical protein
VCVYALIRGTTDPAALRVGGGSERLRVIRFGPVAAVVRDASRPPAPTPANLRRYDHTMRELAGRFSALLPVRFGTCVSAEELAFILSSRRAALAHGLQRVRGRVQMTVRIVGEKQEGVRVKAEPMPTTGRGYLLGRARKAAADRDVPGFEPVRSAVARWVRDERVEHRAGVFTVYHLIPRASADAYRAAAGRAAVATNLHTVVSGPWPPYAFSAD